MGTKIWRRVICPILRTRRALQPISSRPKLHATKSTCKMGEDRVIQDHLDHLAVGSRQVGQIPVRELG